VDASWAKKITAAGVAELRQTRPDLRVRR